MAKKFREDINIKSSLAKRSGLVTENMTSTTPDKIAGTSWKNVLVDENGEIMVGNADIPASSICSGNPLSATNKLLDKAIYTGLPTAKPADTACDTYTDIPLYMPSGACYPTPYIVEKPLDHDYTGLRQFNGNVIGDKHYTIEIPQLSLGDLLTVTPTLLPSVSFNWYQRDLPIQNSTSFDAPYPACPGYKWIAEITVKHELFVNAVNVNKLTNIQLVQYLGINGLFNLYGKGREMIRWLYNIDNTNNIGILEGEFNVISDMLDVGNVVNIENIVRSQYDNFASGFYQSFSYGFVYVKRQHVLI